MTISLEKISDSLGVGFGGTLNIPMPVDLSVTYDYRAGRIKIEKPLSDKKAPDGHPGKK